MKKISLKSIVLNLIFFSLIFQITGTLNALISYPLLEESEIKYDDVSPDKRFKGKFIIKLKDNITENEKNEYLKNNNLKENKGRIITDKTNISFDSKFIDKIEEDSPVKIQTLNTNDPLSKDQWHLEAIGLNQILENKKTSDSKTIAVIDSGICIDHPDLQGRVVEGWNFIDNNSDVSDNNGHGCAVSGVISANTNNNKGITGASIQSMIMPLKVIGNDGVGSYSNLINAIDYAVEKKVDLINISLGGLFDSQILYDSIINAVNKGIKVVASAGNTASNEIMYPAKFSEVFSVGSVENDYTVSDFSSNSSEIDMWTYGNNIISTNKEGDYSKSTGTSIATALASAFILEDGKYSEGNILNHYSDSIKPVFKNKKVTYEEPLSKLSLKVPENLNVEGFENINPQGYIINWQKVIKLAQGETMVVSVWNREKKDLSKLLKTIIERDRCKNFETEGYCLYNFPQKEGQSSSFALYYLKDNNIIRVLYNFNNWSGFNLFKQISLEIKQSNRNLIIEKKLKKIESLKSDKIIAQTTCGGITDPYVDFPCCDNNANCTWWAAHMRHDLRGKVYSNAGLWCRDYENSGGTCESSPSVGAVAVWSDHVAYVKRIHSSTQIEISEMNCNNYTYPFRDSAIVDTNTYGSGQYAKTLVGFIPLSNDCNGNNQIKSNWNINGPKTCNPIGTFTIQPESRLQSSGGDITIRGQ